MNWTGGALSRSRHANPKVSLSVKQKNHFAKARVKLQNGQRPSPPEIQYFDFGEWKPECGVHNDQLSNSVIKGSPSQTTLDQYENVQGVVRKLKSLRSRKEGNKRKRSIINDTEGHVLPSGIAIPPISPTIITSRLPSSSSPIQAEPSERNRLRISTSSRSDELDPPASLDSVEAKRRKLLQESDWVGVERQKRISKPVKMKFTDAKDRDLIGRRRPLNDCTVENRWTVQGSRPMKIPRLESDSEKPRGLHRALADEYWSASGISIRIGSAATNEEPMSEEMLDCDLSPGAVQLSSPSVKTFDCDITGPPANPQHRRCKATAPSAFMKKSSEPFRSRFSPEKVEPSGIAQLVEAATIADDDNLSLSEDKLRLPEDYHFPEPEPGCRLVFERTPQPRGQISEFNNGSSPFVRDFALPKGHLSLATSEQPVSPEDRSALEQQISEHGPVGDADRNTSPLSIATSRYMQELENQSFGPGGPRLFAKNMASEAATARVQPFDGTDKTEGNRGIVGDRQPKNPAQPDVIQDKENIQPTEDEDEIWRDFIDLDDVNDLHPSQEQPTCEHKPCATAISSVPEREQVLHQASANSNVPEVPPPSRDDDELVWKNFIFSDSSPNNDEWVIEEPASSESPPDDQISTYNPARTQPSMIAEVATSPVKQNPHLMDEVMLDDSTPVRDDASRYAHAPTSSAWSPETTENVSNMPQDVSSYYPSDSPDRSSDPTTASPAAHDTTQSHPSSDQPLPKTRNPRISNPSSLLVEASHSPTGPTPYNNNKNNNPSSSDELSWTPSRLPAPPPRKEKIVFKKPSRYVGERANEAPQPVHLGRNVSKGKGGKEKRNRNRNGKKTSLAEAVERAKRKVSGKGRRESRDEGGGREEAEAEAEADRDEIVDD